MPVDSSFSRRFENVVRLTKFFSSQGQDTAQAKIEATKIEEQALSLATTLEDYEGRIEHCIDLHSQPFIPEGTTVEATSNDEETLLDELFNTDGPTLGHYEWATFHADGVTSTIYKAKDTNTHAEEKIVALKVMTPSQMVAPHNAHREVKVLQDAKSKNVVPLLESFQQSGGKLVLVFPFLKQDLENLLRSGRLSVMQSSMVFEGLFSALAHLHKHRIIHRDVKPGNVLLKTMNGPVYLIDFGISWSQDDTGAEPVDKKVTDVGTTCYRPPEILFGDRGYDTSLDMWAAGCVVAEMVTKGHHPMFDAGPMGSELGLIKSMFSTLGTPTDTDWPSAVRYPDWGSLKFQDFPAKSWEEILPGASEDAFDFVSKTVCYEPTRRLTAEEALNHQLAEDIRSRR